MLECLDGCSSIILCQPRPSEANVAPSNLVLQCGAQALAPRFATRRAGSCTSPWHVEVVVTARRVVHMWGRVCPCAHAPWGYFKTNHWFVGRPLAVRRTLHRSWAADLGPDFRQNRP